ncbi:MAG: hypothetical protein ACT4TC_13020 [Myxococcaceae bacterium]
MRTVGPWLGVVVLSLALPAWAEALNVFSSARTGGMGGAGAAASQGAATLHYNPALVAYEESLGAEVDVTAQYDQRRVVPSVAFALNAPLGRTWTVGAALGPGWSLDPRTKGADIPWRTYDLLFSAMWAPAPHVGLSLSAGLTRGALGFRVGDLQASASGWGATARAGFAVRSADERFIFGATYRITGPVVTRGELSGNGTVEVLDATTPVLHQASAGVAYRFSRVVLTTAELDFISWRSLRGLAANTPTTTLPLVGNAPQALAGRLGAELAPSGSFRLRVGGFIEAPLGGDLTDPDGPALPAFGAHAGVGYTSGFFFFDLGAGVSLPHQAQPRINASVAAGLRI